MIVYRGGLRLETVPPRKDSSLFSGAGRPAGRKTIALVLLILVFLGAGWLLLSTFLPLAWTLVNLNAAAPFVTVPPLVRVAMNTVLPAAISVLLVQLPLAYLGGLGIGALRPLGRKSELLLLPFSPWLFVTAGPLSVVFYLWSSRLGLLNTLAAAAPPMFLNVPMLFAFTLFFQGQEPRWRAARAEGAPGAFGRTVILPSLPLAAALGGLFLLLTLQDGYWPSLLVVRQDLYGLPMLLRQLFRQSDWGQIACVMSALFIPIFLLFAAFFAAMQGLFADRLAVTAKSSCD